MNESANRLSGQSGLPSYNQHGHSRQHAASNRYPPLNFSPFELVKPLIDLHAIVPAAIQAIASHIYGNGVYRTDPSRV